MAQLRSLIIDDNPHSRDELKYLLTPHKCVQVVGEADCGETGLQLTRDLVPDIVFLDIKMPNLSGFEFAEIIRSEFKVSPGIVFVTAYKEHSLESHDFHPIHYLVKPIENKQLSIAITWAMNLTPGVSNRLEIRGREAAIAYVEISKIIYLSCKDSITTVHTATRKYETRTTLREYLGRLEKHNFFQTHRSYAVNRNYSGDIRLIKNCDDTGGELVIADCNEIIPLSRNYYMKWIKTLGIT